MNKILIVTICVACFLSGFSVGFSMTDTYEVSEVITDNEPIVENEKLNTYTTPRNSGFKSYMDYTTITNTSSKQYKLQISHATTGEYGIRMVNDRYCIALGSYFTNSIGQYVDLILENGTIIPCVLADQKADIHTDENNIMTLHNGCVAEFVVETSSLNDFARRAGDISYCNKNWMSPVKEVIVYEINIFDEQGGELNE